MLNYLNIFMFWYKVYGDHSTWQCRNTPFFFLLRDAGLVWLGEEKNVHGNRAPYTFKRKKEVDLHWPTVFFLFC